MTHPLPRNLTQFIAQHKVSMTSRPAAGNPNMPADEGSRMTHWRCTLRSHGRSLTIPYSMGLAFSDPPDLLRVLNCLALDAASARDCEYNFEIWAAELGYDSDSRQNERIFHAVVSQSEELRVFLGDEAYKSLLGLQEDDSESLNELAGK